MPVASASTGITLWIQSMKENENLHRDWIVGAALVSIVGIERKKE
jgi:hypothetical protein